MCVVVCDCFAFLDGRCAHAFSQPLGRSHKNVDQKTQAGTGRTPGTSHREKKEGIVKSGPTTAIIDIQLKQRKQNNKRKENNRNYDNNNNPPICRCCVVHGDELERPLGGVHCGVPQLLRHHLSQALEALQLDRRRSR